MAFHRIWKTLKRFDFYKFINPFIRARHKYEHKSGWKVWCLDVMICLMRVFETELLCGKVKLINVVMCCNLPKPFTAAHRRYHHTWFCFYLILVLEGALLVSWNPKPQTPWKLSLHLTRDLLNLWPLRGRSQIRYVSQTHFRNVLALGFKER